VIIGNLVSKHVDSIFNSIKEGSNVRWPYRYHVTGDRYVAHDAALLLVRIAQQWPALQVPAQDIGINSAFGELEYGLSRWSREGKYFYDGWSGGTMNELAQSYDYLFDFVQGNQDFADTIHRYIPAVRTPEDVIKLLDTHLLQTSVSDVKIGRIRQGNLVQIGLVQNPSDYSDELMDLSKTPTDIYPLGIKSILSHYSNSFSQDGTSAIGSTAYASGASDILLNAARDLMRYRNLDQRDPPAVIPFDFSQVDLYPKIKAYADFLLSKTVAGGFRLAVGDVGGPYGRPEGHALDYDKALTIWILTQDPRAAWLLVNEFGRRGQTDQEWAELVNAAGSTRNPVLHTASRVLGGFGVGILESGTNFTNARHKTALQLRTGFGVGHSHYDALDLNLFSMGLRMANDYGQRNEGDLFTAPPDNTSYTHNVVEVDGYVHPWRGENGVPPGSFTQSGAWVNAFKPGVGVQFMSGEAVSATHPNVSLFRRDVALIDRDENFDLSSTGTPPAYVFDVFRVQGGKWHTWSFHGADSGIEPGGFLVNGREPAEFMTRVASNRDTISSSYLRKHANDRKFESPAGDRIDAIWRLSRTASTTRECNVDGTCLDVRTVAAEPNMMGASYDAASPRKYTKATLFGRAGDTLLVGNLFSAYYKMNIPNLYVQNRQPIQDYALMAEKENVYPALIEAYSGTPFITSSRVLSVAPNENDARKGVALEALTADGARDILFSDGRDTLRSVEGGLSVSGRFAYVSDKSGVQRLRLVQGRQAHYGGLSLKPAATKYTATIKSVDYRSQRITTHEKLPLGVLDGQQFYIYNPQHHTSYRVTRVEDAGPSAGSVLIYDKPADVGNWDVASVTAGGITSKDRMVMGDVANRSAGLTVVNEAGDKTWKMEYQGGNSDGYIYGLNGEATTAEDHTDQDGDGRVSVLVYDFGAGDTVEVPTYADLKKISSSEYQFSGDVQTEITLLGSGSLWAFVSGSWKNITLPGMSGPTGRLSVDDLASGPVSLRVSASAPSVSVAALSTHSPSDQDHLVSAAGGSSPVVALDFPTDEIYVSATPSSTPNGTLQHPHSLRDVFEGRVPVTPGATIWLLGGTYVGAFSCSLKGTSENPIRVRSVGGQWAVLDGKIQRSNTFVLDARLAEHVWFMDFEVSNSGTQSVSVDDSLFRVLVENTNPSAGRVTSLPSGVSCGSTCSFDYPAGADIVLYADPNPASSFIGWEGDCSGTQPSCALSLMNHKLVRARFSGEAWGGNEFGGLSTGFQPFHNALNHTKTKTMEIKFTLKEAGSVKMRIIEKTGEDVKTLLDEPRLAGANDVVWDGLNNQGKQVASGVYLLQLKAGGETVTHRIVVVK
jgi:hypothetical protein